MNDQDNGLPLKPLDPGTEDPGFWLRFHARVMTLAKEELVRRQGAGELSVAEVVFAWRRALVPAALMAAALAGIFVVVNEEPAPALPPVALEEALVEDLDGEPIPTFLAREAELDELAFLASAGGF